MVKGQALLSYWHEFESSFMNLGKLLNLSRVIVLGVILPTLYCSVLGLREIIHIRKLVQSLAQNKNAGMVADDTLVLAVCLVIIIYSS